MYRSYSYNNMPRPVNTTAPKTEPEKKIPQTQKPEKPKQPEAKPIEQQSGVQNTPAVIGRLRTDDIVLLIVIAILLLNDCDDKPLLLALAYVFFSDYFG